MDYNALIIPDGSFRWREYALLRQLGTYAIPTPEQRANAVTLFQHLQEYIRTPLNKRLFITSGARTDEYTAYLRSHGTPSAALHSAHNDWAAVDLAPPAGMTNAEFWHWCSERWPGRMEALNATPTWCHLDTRQWGERVRFEL